MAAQIEGSVLLETVVLADGSVGDVSVVKSLDPNSAWISRPSTP